MRDAQRITAQTVLGVKLKENLADVRATISELDLKMESEKLQEPNGYTRLKSELQKMEKNILEEMQSNE